MSFSESTGRLIKSPITASFALGVFGGLMANAAGSLVKSGHSDASFTVLILAVFSLYAGFHRVGLHHPSMHKREAKSFNADFAYRLIALPASTLAGAICATVPLSLMK